MDHHLLLDLVCCTLLVVFFLTRGRTNDSVSWLALIFGIAIILVVCANWNTIAHWVPATDATSAHPAPVSTPAPMHAAVQGMPGTRHPSAVANSPLTSLAPGPVAAVILLVTIVGTMVTLAVVRARRQPRRLHHRLVCRECSQEGQMRQYRYQKGRTRHLGTLCQQCAARWQATLAEQAR